MQNGRILIVSDRKEVVAELEPIIRAGEHLLMTVPDGAEANRLLADGVIPDVMISDLGSDLALNELEYVWQFREMNRVGRHLVIVEEDAPFAHSPKHGVFGKDSVTPLPRPFRRTEVRRTIEDAVGEMARDLHALRAEMYREVNRLHREIRDSQRQMVHAMAHTVAARDPYMQGHSARVTELARCVAAELHLPPEEVDLMETACMLHEIGKVGVPMELLHKQGALGPAELEQIRVHARIGAEIVRGVPSIRNAAPLIEFHCVDHCDLSQFIDPSSPEFMLTAILRVADAYDAMTSTRSYRDALPRSYWEAAIRTGAGREYHPQVVAAFFQTIINRDLRPATRTA